MTVPLSSDHTHQLRSLMQLVGVFSFRALSRAAGVSEEQLRKVRQGRGAELTVAQWQKLSQVLQVSVTDLLATFVMPTGTAIAPSSNQSPSLQTEITQLKQEYQRLQTQLEQQQATLQQTFQQSTLQTLESLLLQLPTAAYAAQQNPQVPASRLLPLLRPIDQLLKNWGIEAIAPVGSELPYDPQLHQLMDGTAEVGDPVKVRYTGYRQGDRLLYRAKVSPQ